MVKRDVIDLSFMVALLCVMTESVIFSLKML